MTVSKLMHPYRTSYHTQELRGWLNYYPQNMTTTKSSHDQTSDTITSTTDP